MVMNGEHGGRCRRHVATKTALVVAVLGTVSCGGAGDTPGSMGGVTPAPSVVTTNSTATPSSDGPRFVKATATPVPGTKEDALFLEAKKVYETYLEQSLLFEQEGGGNVLPAGLKEVIGGPWEEVLQEYYTKVKKRGHHVTPESAGFGDVNLSRIKTEPGYLVTIRSCTDERQWAFVNDAGEKVAQGTLRRNIISMNRKNGRLVMTAASSRRVDKCEN